MNNEILFIFDAFVIFCRPEIQRFLEKLKRQQEAKLNSQENDNRPFILKYVSRVLSLNEIIIFLLVEIHITNCRYFCSSKCIC
jgi:hypothetical protein